MKLVMMSLYKSEKEIAHCRSFEHWDGSVFNLSIEYFTFSCLVFLILTYISLIFKGSSIHFIDFGINIWNEKFSRKAKVCQIFPLSQFMFF